MAGTPRWGDRLLFAALGALVGFAAAWVALEGRHAAPPVAAAAVDPHAGVPGAPPAGGAAMPGGTGIDAAARQHLQEARAAADARPGDYDALVHLGNSAFDAREFAQAADAYERALKVRPGDANVMTDLGTAYRNEGQADKALDLFRKAHAADPGNWQSLYNEVIVLMSEKQDLAGARAAFERLKKEQPSLPALAGLEQQLNAAAGGK